MKRRKVHLEIIDKTFDVVLFTIRLSCEITQRKDAFKLIDHKISNFEMFVQAILIELQSTICQILESLSLPSLSLFLQLFSSYA